ncbi:MAG: polysaccharide deacetylase family protein [Sulfurospirillum sp.]|nr:polysaccharide deacetylase family protein [Sulfurospirillum sp.]
MKYLLCLFFYGSILWADAHIFVYHRFEDNRYPSTNTSVEQLRKDFTYLKENGYKVVPLEKLITALKAKETIPDKWVVLSIDDNYKSFYEHGLTIFQEYNYPFSLFVFVEATHKKYPDYTTWDELREIAKYGSLEFHTYAHGHMTHMSNAQILQDFDKGMSLLKEKLNIKPKYFSYPYGEYSMRVKNLVKNYGFEAIINQNMGAIASFSDAFDLDRTALVGKSDLAYTLSRKALNAQWLEPQNYPEDGILKKITIQTDTKEKQAKVYLTGHGWRDVTLQDGNLDLTLEAKLLHVRSRVLLDINNKITNKLIIKDTYGTQ